MLEYKTKALLDIINIHCQNGGYKVFLIKDLISAMPKAFDVDEEAMLECLENLKNHQYISIKYQDDVEICLKPLIKGKVESEDTINHEIEKMKCQKQYFLASFLGSLAGVSFMTVVICIIVLLGGK